MERPKCKCHGEPMLPRKDRPTNPWRCVIKRRLYHKRYRETHKYVPKRTAQGFIAYKEAQRRWWHKQGWINQKRQRNAVNRVKWTEQLAQLDIYIATLMEDSNA